MIVLSGPLSIALRAKYSNPSNTSHYQNLLALCHSPSKSEKGSYYEVLKKQYKELLKKFKQEIVLRVRQAGSLRTHQCLKTPHKIYATTIFKLRQNL